MCPNGFTCHGVSLRCISKAFLELQHLCFQSCGLKVSGSSVGAQTHGCAVLCVRPSTGGCPASRGTGVTLSSCQFVSSEFSLLSLLPGLKSLSYLPPSAIQVMVIFQKQSSSHSHMQSLKLLLVSGTGLGWVCVMQRACFLGRCSFSKETAVPFLIFVTTAGSQNGLFHFF